MSETEVGAVDDWPPPNYDEDWPTLDVSYISVPPLSTAAFELCESGTAARLRRMERIARKYRRRWYRFALICESVNFPAAAKVCLRVAIALDDILSA